MRDVLLAGAGNTLDATVLFDRMAEAILVLDHAKALSVLSDVLGATA